jgi:predicted nuclease of predicted toxin-antitoxin system
VKIKLDENMPDTLAQDLRLMGHDVHTVPQEQLTGQSDPVIWAAAKQELRFLITQDLDFSDVRQFTPGLHAGILLVRLRNPGRIALTQTVVRAFMDEEVAGWAGCVVVLTERKIRIHRP